MAYGVRLRVWGDRACFTRPEMKAERVSYDVMTPSAARGLLEAVHWKPAIRWVVDRIHVLRPIRFNTVRRNEVGEKIPPSNVTKAMKGGTTEGLHKVVEEDRQQRATTYLSDVDYLVEAHFVLTDDAAEDDTEAKHLSMFNRRAEKGQCFQRPYLGVREFPADFALVTGDKPKADLPPDQRDRDLGWLLYDIDYKDGMTPLFFRARLRNGILDVPRPGSEEMKA